MDILRKTNNEKVFFGKIRLENDVKCNPHHPPVKVATAATTTMLKLTISILKTL